MELSDAFVNTVAALTGAVVGGVITGVFTLKATDKAIRDENAKEARRDEREVENLLKAIKVELTALWTFHMKRIGYKLEHLPDGQALEFYYPLTQEYFTIYNSNAHLIGRIGDDALREAIVVCYNKCKKVVDGFKFNNDLYMEWHHLKNTPTGDNYYQARLEAKHKALADYAPILKEDHEEIKIYVDRLAALLQAHVK